MKTHEQRLAKAAEEEEHAFNLMEKHLRNLFKAYNRFKKARKKAQRTEEKIHKEREFDRKLSEHNFNLLVERNEKS